jgi:hypothetical protein
MKKCLYLHIGTPKTATTSIQSFLFQNGNFLAAQGYIYPKTGIQYNAHHTLGNLFRHSPLDWIKVQKPDSESLKSDIKKEVLASRCSNVIMSTESFFHAGILIERIPEFFEDFCVKIVVVLRQPDGWIESALRDDLKTGQYAGTAEDYIATRVQFVDYNAQIAPWAKVFGKDNIIVQTFEPGQASIPEEHRFLNLIGAKILPGMSIPERENDRLSQDCLAFLGMMKEKRRISEKHFHFFGVLQNYSRLHPDLPEHRSMLSPQQRAYINSRVAAGNREIAQTYLGRDHLFTADTGTEDPWQPYPGLSAQKAVEIAEHLADRLFLAPRKA